MRPLEDVAQELGLAPTDVTPWGPGVAKLTPEAAFAPRERRGRLVLVSAITPTPAGEGKTTCAIGLTQAAQRLGVRAACALREPSLGPVFGAKGGGTGGGRSELIPAVRINLHFTGDLHAVTSAHNLLAALVDNDLHFGGGSGLDPRATVFRRVLDLNDRSLRKIVTGLGGPAMGVPRETAFDITAASEVMAILCLARDYVDLKTRLGQMIVGFTRDRAPVRARDFGADGPMAALLRDALLPNLVQTTEGAPALVHGGPFGNIAHGCSSVIGTQALLQRADLVFTEAGFGFDLGAEKFLDITCRTAGFWPHAVVLVATLRALKYHGGVDATHPSTDDRHALSSGLENLHRHIESARVFGFDPVVVVNVRAGDQPEELAWAVDELRRAGVAAAAADVFTGGGDGGREGAALVIARAHESVAEPRFLYDLAEEPAQKMRRIATTIYGARDVQLSPLAQQQVHQLESLGVAQLPVCMAKTHLSLSDDPTRRGRPTGFKTTVREVRIAAGAGYLVPLTGDIATMPGLPKRPQASGIDLRADGTIVGVH